MAGQGLLIALEGPEGAGKSTQAARIAAGLEADGLHVLVTREPGGTAAGEAIRGILLERIETAILPQTEALLYAAARAQHVRDIICPALASGTAVICDRFIDSTLAYQGGGRGLSLDDLRALHQFAAGGIQPDLRLLFDLPVEHGLERRFADATGLNRLDGAGKAFHNRVRETYLRLAKAQPDTWIVIDAMAPPERVTAEAIAGIRNRLAARLDALKSTGHASSTRETRA